jgi:signal transduction histidine kinase
MEPKVKDRIFDPLFTTKFVGRGMGMAMVWGIASAHKGLITIESAPERGTTATVLFARWGGVEP